MQSVVTSANILLAILIIVYRKFI